MPKSLYPQHVVQPFCCTEKKATLRVWNKHQYLSLLQEMGLVSNMRMLRYESCAV